MAGVHHTCSVVGCNSKATRVGSGLCEKHYYRLRRNGTTDYVGNIKPGDLINHYGYVLTPARGHPRSLGRYRALEHRVVFYNEHGEGPFACHWCGITVTWNDMHVDHLNDVTDDNQSGNLVPSCPTCNIKRGSHKSVESSRKAGKLLTLGSETLCVAEWSRRICISRSAIEGRLAKGWTVERALTEPRGRFGPRAATGIGG